MPEAEEIITKLIKEIAVEHNFVDYDLKIVPVSSGGANYTSNLYNVTVKEGGNTHNLFAKVAAMGEKVRSQSPRFYHTEMFVYTKLAKTYDEIQDSHDVPQENRLVLSKFYGCHPTLYEETVVLENLVLKGYQSYDRFISINWEYAIASLTEMTKLHALSLAYSEYYPEDFNKVADELKFEWDMANGPLVEYFKMVTTRAMNMVRDDSQDKLRRFFEEFGSDKFMSLFKATGRSVLVHGDFRPSNLMHKSRDDGTVDIKVLDLQTMQAASPVVDLLYFIFTGSDEQFRAQYYDKLIDHYYSELEAAMKRLHLDPEKVYSRADFDYELKEKLPLGLSIAVFTLPIVTVATEDAPKVNEDMDLTSFSVEKTSDLYSERLNGIVNDFLKWGILK